MSDQSTGRIVPLTQGFFAVVDEEDFERVSKFCWLWSGGYAKRTVRMPDGKRKTQYLARFIMGEPPEMEVDHRSMNTLDNRKENLRICTKAQNHRNRRVQKNSRSGIKGVHFHKVSGKWNASIRHNRKRKFLGAFTTPEEAAQAYSKAAAKLHGEFARSETPLIPEHRLAEVVDRPLKITNKSGHRGVCWTNADKRWKASISVNKREFFLGNFTTIEDAVLARKRAEALLQSTDTSTLTGGMLRSACAQMAAS